MKNHYNFCSYGALMMRFCSNSNSLFTVLKILVRTFFQKFTVYIPSKKESHKWSKYHKGDEKMTFLGESTSLTITQSNRIQFLLTDQPWSAFKSHKCLTNTPTNTPRILCQFKRPFILSGPLCFLNVRRTPAAKTSPSPPIQWLILSDIRN